MSKDTVRLVPASAACPAPRRTLPHAPPSASTRYGVATPPRTIAPEGDPTIIPGITPDARRRFRLGKMTGGSAAIQARLDLYKDFESPVIFPSHRNGEQVANITLIKPNDAGEGPVCG